jgi:hypothetical protein
MELHVMLVLPKAQYIGKLRPHILRLAAHETRFDWRGYTDLDLPVMHEVSRIFEVEGVPWHSLSLHEFERPAPENRDQCRLHRHKFAIEVYILEGSYEMQYGLSEDGNPPGELHTVVMEPGSTYCMPSTYWWHNVHLITERVLSVMIHGPWQVAPIFVFDGDTDQLPEVNTREWWAGEVCTELQKFRSILQLSGFAVS